MKYFSLKELRADKAPAKVQAKITDLITYVLDPFRELIKVPIIVNSGYRSPEYNKSVGGVPTSQHCKGEASDIVPKMNIREAFEVLIDNFEFDQAIYEDRGDTVWIHVSYVKGKNRKQVLHANKVKGVWKYTPYKRMVK